MQSCLCGARVRCQCTYDSFTFRTTTEMLKIRMQCSRDCPVVRCVRIPELFVRFPTSLLYFRLYYTKSKVTSHYTSTGLFESVPGLEHMPVIPKKHVSGVTPDNVVIVVTIRHHLIFGESPTERDTLYQTDFKNTIGRK